ncbi:EF-hand calcium-binding domain-containing protein 5 [Oxyura jamaicensis]|uniref:EF-hand calcium-binding domain-containing protein 5 n=1 Tax=Oxyura jamaicensis TaxID=8884 RepID=UPI0015A56848|nr:EF-hand calcium-binding domain-containing protein 5 [Oxyura jamaicensis]
MAAQPEEAAQTAGLKHPRLVDKNTTATEMKRNQGSDELPCRSNCAPWKECFYEKVQQRSLNLQEKKVKMIQAQKANEEKVKKREPCDWLCKEWFSDEKESLDTRTYLLDKLLPTLIPGVEKLLMQVERKKMLVPDKEPTKFDPITFLGEYLMRHNPQYDISTKPGPYLRGMKMVTEELKTEMADTAPERLARMKAEAKTKRKEREQVENMKSEQKEMRKEALAIQFKEWTVDISGRIPVALIQSALRSFLDVIASAPMDAREAIYDRKLEIVDTLEKKVNVDEFTEYVHSYTETFSNDMFQEILKHLRQCALDFQKAIRCDMWRQMFTDLFLDCDYGKDAPVAEAVKETAAKKESFLSLHSGQFGQQTSSETRLQDEDLQDQGKGPAYSDGQDSQTEAGQEFELPWSGDLLTSDLSFKYSSYGERIPEEWICENTRFADLRPIMADIENRCTSRVRSAFDENCLNLPQFVQLMETFVGQDISLPTVKSLIEFIKGEYKQTEESKIEQLEKVCHTSRLAQRKLLLEALFEKWDMNASGFLDLKEVDAVLSTFKEGMEKEALRKAKSRFSSRYPQSCRVEKLSPKAFQTFLELVASEFTGDEDEVIDNLVEFLTTSVERSWMECLQSLTRRKWLHNIQQAAETSGASMEPVYKAVFKALSQDAEAHGDNKKISAYIALLEENQLSPERGQILLHYVACTADDAPYVLNQILYKDMKGVSFAAVEEGKPIHVPRVQLHGNIHFWNCDRPVEERRGSLLVLPLQDAHWRVFGILGLDTLRDQREKTIFLTHEISFCQGVSLAFSKAYHHVCTLENVLQMALTALDWLYPRVPSIHTVITYLVEPGKDQTCDYALRKMITTDNTGQKEIHTAAVLFLRKENLLRDYLFKCIDTSEVVRTSVCGEYHIAVPLRDLSRQALGLFDISIGHHQKLPPHEHKDLQKMLKTAQAACCEILKIPSEETKATYVLEAEYMNLRHAGILFHRFMLQDLRECVQKLNAESFAEIKSFEEPPALVHNIVKAVLLLFNPKWKGSEKIESWSQCMLNLDDNLIQEIYCFDPTASSVQVQGELLLDCIGGVPRAEVWKQGSVPAEYLYNWVHTCLSLMEMTKSLQNKKAPAFTSKV